MATLHDVHEILRAVKASGLADAGRLKAFAQRLKSEPLREPTPAELRERVVADGLLTGFQFDEVRGGRGAELLFAAARYRILDRIGFGAVADVYSAVRTADGQTVALKVMNGEYATEPVARERLVREAEAAMTIAHAGVIRVFAVEPEHTPPYLVMEYVDGVTLQEAVALSGTFRVEEVARCGRELATALRHTHAAGLVHRDVKPSNVLLVRADGTLKLLDLGDVRVSGAEALTAVGASYRSILGTFDYQAPEQAEDSAAVDGRADIYSLGATLYFLLAGHPPYHECPPGTRLLRKRTAPTTPIDALRPDVPAAFSALIARMLAPDPAERPPTPEAVAVELVEWAGDADVFAADFFARVQAGRQLHNRTGSDSSAEPASSPSAVPATDSPTPTEPIPWPPRRPRRTTRLRPVRAGTSMNWLLVGVGVVAGLIASGVLAVAVWLLAAGAG